jgi:hypothetical protein
MRALQFPASPAKRGKWPETLLHRGSMGELCAAIRTPIDLRAFGSQATSPTFVGEAEMRADQFT